MRVARIGDLRRQRVGASACHLRADYWEVMHGKYSDYWVSAWANKLNAIMLMIFTTVLLAADIFARFRPNRLSVEVHPDHILFQRQGWLPCYRLGAPEPARLHGQDRDLEKCRDDPALPSGTAPRGLAPGHH